MLEKLKSVQWQPFAAGALVLGAYYGCRAAHLDPPQWLAEASVFVGAGVLMYVRGMFQVKP